MKIKVSDFIANYLSDYGITDIFTITGGGAMHMNDSFGHHEKLQCIYNNHEQACAIAAESYARLTGKLAAVCVTSGPGGTNALTGVMGGWLDSIPMFIISGQVKRETTIWSTELPLRQLGDQEFNIVDCVSCMTKYAAMITDANDILYHLEKALYMATHGRPGPVWLDVPLDIQATIVDTENLKKYDSFEYNANLPYKPRKETLELVIKKIQDAKRPVILAGSAIRLSNSHNEFIQLIEKLNIPVVTAWNSHDVLWDSHPLYCGRPGTLGLRGGNIVVENCDLLIDLGCRLNIRQISYNFKSFAKHAYKIMVDIDVAELHKPTLHIDMPIHADLREVIDGLNDLEYNANSLHKDWLLWCRLMHQKYPAVQPHYWKTISPINPYVFVEKMFEHLNNEDAVVTSNGSACVIGFQAAKIKEGQRLYTNSGCASMGYGLPAALGACIARGNKRVICLEGDGSIQMNIQELATISFNKLNVKVIWMNNDGYHSIRQTQTNLFDGNLVGADLASGVPIPDAEKIANAFELPYIKISSLTELDIKIEEMLSINGPVLCEVVLDAKQNFEPKLSSRIHEDGTITSPALDDMYPFLSREEYNDNKYKC